MKDIVMKYEIRISENATTECLFPSQPNLSSTTDLSKPIAGEPDSEATTDSDSISGLHLLLLLFWFLRSVSLVG